jgi:RHS repeat-associated protein
VNRTHPQIPLKSQHSNTAVCSAWDKGYRYGFNSMEKDNEINVNGGDYDFGARIYDSRLGRWLSLDPLMKIYPKLSPYNFVDNSPLNSIDKDGKDIIILCANITDGHPTGHQAVLIGNEDDGWWYYSFDSDDGVDNDGKSIGVYFKTIDEFTNSQHNSYQKNYDNGGNNTLNQYEDAERDKDGKVIQRYNQGYRIKTDKVTDQKMKNAAEKFLMNNDYELIGDNCTDIPRVACDAGGLKNGESTEISVVVCFLNICTTIETSVPNYLPESKQDEIEKSNQGTSVDHLLKRTTSDGNITPTVPQKSSTDAQKNVKYQKDNTNQKVTQVEAIVSEKKD